MPVVGFSLGYPDEAPPIRDRLPFDGLVHEDVYQDYSDQRIREIYQERDVKGWELYEKCQAASGGGEIRS